ncbi:MAG: macrocin O-methyltransferase [Gammaproteobacteria bacterium]|nr:macrocin O-methyltransferase [Gammaproteobacteria bacterium]NIR81736.1 macrocin O-methyltransferase [Gammaproteobacteria bacterium]NIR88539.1 macrocin O-methyltransferase [Gammaproteobacteria bacterium]NIU02843.1 macrocin O-methyltransferase [Gammaproteobacteria bacterium]NIV50365.1 macrocin O-methyltransferase [Gammaproteobacteria bacterium]
MMVTSNSRELYIDQLKRSLMDWLNVDVPAEVIDPENLDSMVSEAWLEHFLFGRAVTFCGMAELDNLQACAERCLEDAVAGDFMECGVWRGGATILLRGILAAHGVTDRRVWVADSFEGLPPPPPGSLEEVIYNHEAVVRSNHMAVDLETVKNNFARYGLLDGQVRFVKGWFKDTLPDLDVERLAILRLDAGSYSATMDILGSLYDKVSPGGYVIIDDWGFDQICGVRKAVEEFRAERSIADAIAMADWRCGFWRKSR